MPSNDFWSRKKVLITGHTGFKGSWLSLWLQSLGAEVTGYALEPMTSPNLHSLCKLEQTMRSVTADIRNRTALLDTIQDTQPEVIFHMAAQPFVRYSYQYPVETFEVNVLGAVNLLDAARTSIRDGVGIKAIINVTTDKCYENKEWTWGYREIDRLGGFDPYSNSKACSELVTASFRNSFFHHKDYANHGLSVATARAGNVIGGGDWSEDRLVPNSMRALLSGSKLEVRHPQATRPWQHVLEPLQGYLLLAQKMVERGTEFGDAWNFGPMDANSKSVEWLVQTIGTLWGEYDFYELSQGSNPHEADNLSLDSSKARRALGWEPVWDVKTALEKTVDWFQAYRKQADMKALCLEQLDAYSRESVKPTD
ncbi:CDP-glucose 4,6-dehydratase [Cohnella herbarum]|uniref:CDP-glucose 4,6-dehydratase n=1 Tax=Cohnella herbarum TaxID=2728023 RepID=A0A7Z2ZKJ2_9BACL|nr:CDP-glucose 4,6-dehydratase [Cohnella herbarum]QJD82895.1 CDP-glucose 4,6-dehydratase [Cohnella herbarum]